MPLRNCLPPVQVEGYDLAPALKPGDLLVPVSCQVRHPRLGEFVLAGATSRDLTVLRYIAPLRARHGHLTWDGRRYRILSESALKGRVLSVRRQGRTFDLAVPRGWKGRDWILITGHRLLAMLWRLLHKPSAPLREIRGSGGTVHR